MEYPRMRRPIGSYLLLVFETIYGVMGIISGLILITDPSGAGLGFTDDVRLEIPFQSFLPVGLFLFIVFGMVPLLLALGAYSRKEYVFGKVSNVTKHHWSWTGGMVLMATLVIWLLAEGYLIGLDYAATYMTVGLGLLVLVSLVLPSTRSYYSPSGA